MLVLQLKDGESLVLTDDKGMRIQVVLCRTGNAKAKLGVNAPSQVRVMRSTLEERAEKADATATASR